MATSSVIYLILDFLKNASPFGSIHFDNSLLCISKACINTPWIFLTKDILFDSNLRHKYQSFCCFSFHPEERFLYLKVYLILPPTSSDQTKDTTFFFKYCPTCIFLVITTAKNYFWEKFSGYIFWDPLSLSLFIVYRAMQGTLMS